MAVAATLASCAAEPGAAVSAATLAASAVAARRCRERLSKRSAAAWATTRSPGVCGPAAARRARPRTPRQPRLRERPSPSLRRRARALAGRAAAPLAAAAGRRRAPGPRRRGRCELRAAPVRAHRRSLGVTCVGESSPKRRRARLDVAFAPAHGRAPPRRPGAVARRREGVGRVRVKQRNARGAGVEGAGDFVCSKCAKIVRHD